MSYEPEQWAEVGPHLKIEMWGTRLLWGDKRQMRGFLPFPFDCAQGQGQYDRRAKGKQIPSLRCGMTSKGTLRYSKHGSLNKD